MKPIYIVLLTLTIVGVSYFYWAKESRPVPVLKSAKVIPVGRQIFLGKRSVTKVNKENSCPKIHVLLSDLDFSTDYDYKSLRPVIEECEDSKYQAIISKIKDFCPQKKNECRANLLFLRAFMRTEGVDFSYDAEVLADLILKEFAKAQPDFKNLEKFADEMLLIHPENQNFQKLWAMSRLMANIEQKNFSAQFKQDIYDRLDPEVISNPELMTYRMFLETGFNPEKAETFAKGLVENYPLNPNSWEMLGWSLWQQGKKEDAVVQVKRALSLNPHDEYLKNLLDKIKSPNAGREAYQGRMNLGISIEELYQ